MGTSYNIKLLPGNRVVSEERLKRQVQSRLDELEALMSTYQSASELSQFNRHPVDEPFVLSRDTFRVIAFAQKISMMSGGSFDVTVGPLVDLWGFGAGSAQFKPPNANEIEQVQASVGYQRIALNAIDQSVVKHANLQIDLSAIAKGYAVDEIVELIKSLGVSDYLVEVGGETRTAGMNDKGTIWRLGIEKPDHIGRSALAVVEVDNLALATSGDYRNFFVSDGKRYSHTISPKTGRPVEHGLASVSVLAESCMEADALATALLVMGEEKGYNFAQEKNLKAYFIYRDDDQYKIRLTDGFKPFLL